MAEEEEEEEEKRVEDVIFLEPRGGARLISNKKCYSDM